MLDYLGEGFPWLTRSFKRTVSTWGGDSPDHPDPASVAPVQHPNGSKVGDAKSKDAEWHNSFFLGFKMM
jgi:hypothetical protein